MTDDDWLVPTYRSNAMQLARGVPMADVLRFRRGYAEFGSDHDLPILPEAVPVASQIPHATGLGMAANYRDSDEAVLCCFGDGATSEGDFHEGLNFAGVFETPVVFYCENNGWAISTPERAQTASDTIAGKADAYGIEGRRVDGNDVLAMYAEAKRAVESAREGEGPTLIEALTYRMGPHSSSDDPDRYVPEEEIEAWAGRDPIDRFRTFLIEQGVITETEDEQMHERITDEIEAGVQSAEDAEGPTIQSMVEDVYDEVPWHLQEQADDLKRFYEED